MITKNVWLIGTGYMAIEYAKVLKSFGVDFIVVGRSEKNCNNFHSKTGINPISGGLGIFLNTKPDYPTAVINATGIEALTSTTRLLLIYGIKYILLEKPGFGNPNELKETKLLADSINANVLIAYNRRFYSSVFRAQEIISEDGGVKSFTFEFTEWSHSIKNLNKHKVELENWFYGNSTHLIDLAFYLGGKPISISTFQKGKLDWHPSGEVYSGAGVSESGALFSYIANWSCPGRWVLELCTTNFRLIFKPVETLQIMKLGILTVNTDDQFEDELDQHYKPGLYRQIESFLNLNITRFSSINEQIELVDKIYKKINKD